MASTAEGRELTRAQQAAQIALANQAASESRLLWGRLDIDDLDGSTPYWLASSTIAVNRRTQESQRLAATYLNEYRRAEIGLGAAVVLAAPSSTPSALRLAGPVRIKKLIKAGMRADDAYERTYTKYEGIVRRQTMMGGRLTVAATTGKDRRALGWRRVTDGNPCAFCALLASRGPVYQSEATADGVVYHGHCGCSAEPSYTVWEPDEREEEYVDEYANAAARVRDAGRPENVKTIAAEMRRSGIFRDSPKTPG